MDALFVLVFWFLKNGNSHLFNFLSLGVSECLREAIKGTEYALDVSAVQQRFK